MGKPPSQQQFLVQAHWSLFLQAHRPYSGLPRVLGQWEDPRQTQFRLKLLPLWPWASFLDLGLSLLVRKWDSVRMGYGDRCLVPGTIDLCCLTSHRWVPLPEIPPNYEVPDLGGRTERKHIH